MLIFTYGQDLPANLRQWIRDHIAATDLNERVHFQPLEPQITCNLDGEDEPYDYNAVMFEGPNVLELVDIAAIIEQSADHTGILFIVVGAEQPFDGAINGHPCQVEILT